MNEKVAQDVQVKENGKLTEKVEVSFDKDISKRRQAPLNLAEDTCNSDEVIAKMLQRQSDEEYVEMCKSTKNNFKGASEISSNYQNTQNQTGSESDDEEFAEDPDEERFWDRFDKLEKEFNIMPTCGLRLAERRSTITKHGITMSNRKNACKTNLSCKYDPGYESFLRERFRSLDISEIEHILKRCRMFDHEVDIRRRTCKLLNEMIFNRVIEGVHSVLHGGKQSLILHASIVNSKVRRKEYVFSKASRKEYALKVFRYIRDDEKFENEELGRKIIGSTLRRLARKEMRVLDRLKRLGVPCPEVIALKEHILVMGFIGEDGCQTPQLMYARLNKNQYTAAYNQVVKCMDIMYKKAGLIHADLSGENILWYNDKCYFIGVSKSVEPGEANAFQFLMKDCQRISKFFKNKGVEDVKTAEELFFDITGCDYSDKLALSVMEKFKMKLHFIDRADSEGVSGKSRTDVPTKTEHAQDEEPVVPPVDPFTT